MGRKLVLVALLFLLAGCQTPLISNSGGVSNIVLLPHHLIVENIIEEYYQKLVDRGAEWNHIMILSPDHFSSGTSPISPAVETEHGFTIHRDLAQQYFPEAEIEGYMIQNSATSEELIAFMESHLLDENTLTIFTIDFSHYLPGQIAHIHDLRSIDILEARDVEEVRSIEVDSPATAELLIRLLLTRNEVLTEVRNTNPSYDIGVESFENTTHVFALSAPLAPGEIAPTRTLSTQMFFAHPREWYLGRTMEDRYLYGYDQVFFDQGGTADQAVVQTLSDGTTTQMDFNYFE